MVSKRNFIHPLPRWAHDRPVTALMCCLSIVVIGLFALIELPLEFSPETASTWMWINVPYFNSTPEEVDSLIGEPLEAQLKLMRSVKRITLTSSTQGCSANVQFDADADMDNAYLEARDAIERVKVDFPADVGNIRIFRQKSDDIPILWMGLSLPGKTLDQLYWVVNDQVKPALERIQGVASVEIHGLEGENLHIDLDMDSVQAHGVSLYELYGALSVANENPSVGSINDGGNKSIVRTRYRLDQLTDYLNLPINNGSLTLADIATVESRLPEMESVHHINGDPGFTISVNKESSANAVEVGREVNEVLSRLKEDPELKGLTFLPFFDQSGMIVSSLRELLNTGLWGAFFAFIILFLFTRHLGATSIIIVSVPLSILTATIGLYFGGFSMNIGTMMGLMLAIGMLVDNSVVSAENIYRLRKIGKKPREAAIIGASEVGTAINASTFTTIIVFLPLFFAAGDMGIWMKQIGYPIVLSLMASLFIALSLVPLAITRLIKKPFAHESKLIPIITRAYLRVLKITLNNKLITILIILSLLATIPIAVKQIPMNMEGDPAMRRQVIRIVPPENYDLKQREEVLTLLENVLLENKDYIDLNNLYSSVDMNNGSMRLFLKTSGSDLLQDDLVRERIRELLPKLPGVNWWFGWQEGGSEGQVVDVTFHGNSPERLRELAQASVMYLKASPGIVDVVTGNSEAMQEIHLKVNNNLAQKNQISPMAIAQTVGIALMGRKVSRFHVDDHEIDVRMQLQPEDRETLHQLMNLQIFTGTGAALPLKALTQYTIVPGPGAIERINGKIKHTIQVELANSDMKLARKEITAAMSYMKLPPGYSWNFGVSFFDFDMGLKQTQQAFLLASILVLLLLGALFESLLHPFTIFLSLPFALVGAFWALCLTGSELNITGNIGLIILIGIVVNNAIVLVDHINQLRAKGLSRRKAILQAGEDRFRPIIMTASTTILGLTPMALSTGDMSARMYTSLAITVIGGLISSTILTLLVIPLIYSLMDNLQRTMIQWFRSFSC